MTTTEIEQRGPAVSAAALMGGANMTATGRAEVARAVAEVMAKVQLARAFPRDIDIANRRVSLSVTRWAFAKRAFYRYPRGRRYDEESGEWVTNFITGPSIHLARELAAAWQNLEFDVVELDRDPERNIAVVRAFCRDNELNVESAITWIVPLVTDRWEGPKHKRVKVKEALEDERDKYERVANEGARRVRSRIFDLLPAWFVDEAIAACNETLARGEPGPDGEVQPEPVRMSKAVDKFAATFGIRKDQLERHVGAPFPDWRTHDLAALTVLYETLARGELRIDEVFPKPGADDAADAAEAPAAPPERPPLMGNTRLELERLFGQAGLGGRTNTQKRMRIAGVLAADELDIAPVAVRKWKDLDNDQALAAQAGVRKLLALPEDERSARIEELDEMGRQAAQVPEDGGRDAETSALDRLRARFTEAGRGDLELHGDLMLAVTSVLVHGHWEELTALEALTQQQVEYALGRLDSVFADARRREENVGDRMDRLYQSVQQQRAAADRGDDEAAGPDDEAGAPGE